MIRATAAIVFCFSVVFANAASASNAKWLCTKGTKVLFHSDADSADKKRVCEKDGGTWKQKQAEPQQTQDSGASSGSGGGW